jgi:hypothetical protein
VVFVAFFFVAFFFVAFFFAADFEATAFFFPADFEATALCAVSRAFAVGVLLAALAVSADCIDAAAVSAA